MLLLASSFAWATQVSTQQLLISRGLTRREADSVSARHRRRHKAQLAVAELDTVLDSLDALELQPEQAAHLLRSTPIATLQELLSATSGAGAAADGGPTSSAGAWCSYKKQLCDCGATHRSDAAVAAAERPPPRLVAVDCEFSPLRVAAVDEAGRVLYDALVLPPVEAAGTPSKSKGMLRCDIAATPPTAQAEVRASILALLTAGEGCVWLAHTPQHDLSALGLSEEDLAAQGVVIVDIGQLGLPPSGQVRSLKNMAAAHLGTAIQKGGQKHCAVQDALVTLQVYEKIREDSTASEV